MHIVNTHIFFYCNQSINCNFQSSYINYNSKERGIMLGAQEQRSEVARLLSQISAEYEASQRGLTGLADGTAQHECITARMEHMGQLHGELQTLVGDRAIAMIAEQLNNVR